MTTKEITIESMKYGSVEGQEAFVVGAEDALDGYSMEQYPMYADTRYEYEAGYAFGKSIADKLTGR